MQRPEYFADLLAAELGRAGYTPGQAAQRAGLPKPTVVNWLAGRVRKPRSWQDILKLAGVLGSDLVGVIGLLQAAGYPPLGDLQVRATAEEQALFTRWRDLCMGGPLPPFQAIAAPAYFVGRSAELADLQARLLAPQHEAVCCLQGMGGVGKTTLAAQIAYTMRPYFPDGVLWARLDTADPVAVAGTFASAYGRDVSAYRDLESRSRVLREVLAHKRALMVLDNAESGAAVEPFLPPTGPCAVLITTRCRHLQVAARMYRLPLTSFSPGGAESQALFEQFLGTERVAAEQAILHTIADLLGHLPLALTIIASRLAQEPETTAAGLLLRLQQEHHRLQELVYDHWNIQLSFQCSYDVLTTAQQTVFAALGVLAGEDFDLDAAAAVAGQSRDDIAPDLGRLYNLSLVQTGRQGRYQLHPLLRAVADSYLQDVHAEARMVTFYLRFVEQHAGDYAALDQEWSNIRVALDRAARAGVAPLLPRAVVALYPYLEARGQYAFADTLLEQAHALARSEGSSADQIPLLAAWGRVAERQGDYPQAAARLEEGLRLAKAANDNTHSCALLTDLGIVARQQGHLAPAAAYFHEGLEFAQQRADPRQQAQLLGQLGILSRQRGDYLRAEQYYCAGLALARTNGDAQSICALLASLSALAGQRGDHAVAETYLQEARTLAAALGHQEQMLVVDTNLGLVASQRGNYLRAVEYLQVALARARSIGHRERICLLLVNLAAVSADHGRVQEAEPYLVEGAHLARDLAHPWLLCALLDEWGELHVRQQRWAAAEAAFGEVLQIASTCGLPEYTAAALYGRSQVAAAQGEYLVAWELGRRSETLYTQLKHPKLAVVSNWLTTLPTPPPLNALGWMEESA